MKTKFVAATLLIMFLVGNVFAQEINKPKLDSLLNILAEKNKAMGSLTISKNGTIVYSKAIGYSSVSGSEKKSATTLTKYRIGSISKMFTATMIFQLVEEGKISLNTTLDNYFPAIPNAEKITIGNLLNHRSGIHNFTSDPDYTTWMTQPKSQGEMIALIAKNQPDFQPNEKTSYSNSNFVLLGYIIEKITKKSYATNLKERITLKIGLANTYYGGKTDVNNNESFSYQFANGWQQLPETDMSIPGGAGALVSTPTDLTKFIEALFSLKLVSNNSLIQMKTMTDGLGMGMAQIPFYSRMAYGHNGAIDGFVSNVAWFPEDRIAVSYCTNGMVYPFNDILIGVLSICFNRDYAIPTFKTIALKTEELDPYLGVYASTQLPLKITITKNGSVLTAQATGQSSFPLEASAKDMFKFDQAGVKMEFRPEKNEMTLKQNGAEYLFTKEK
jgi:CubicO group peptidase (beta-lactamase class C family)